MAAQYPTGYGPELSLGSDFDFAQLPGISQSELLAFGGLAPGGIQPEGAIVVAKVVANDCADSIPGWSFALALPDGGPLPDGGYQLLYFEPGFTPAPGGGTATTKTGTAMFYNIDPTLSSFLTFAATNPDAGSCQPMNAELGFTGRVYVTGGGVTIAPVLLP
jgi:hypothetical protein